MRFAALSVGAGVPAADFAGRIAEVHARAVLLTVADGRPVTLVAHELGRLPRAHYVRCTPPVSHSGPFLAPGVEVAARGAVLRVAGAALSIDLRGARHWRSGLCCAKRRSRGRGTRLAVGARCGRPQQRSAPRRRRQPRQFGGRDATASYSCRRAGNVPSHWSR